MTAPAQTTQVQAPARFRNPESLQALVHEPAYANRFKELLRDRSDQFLSSLIQVGNTMPDVQPRSILACGMMAAALDLPVNKSLGFAWIVPYKERGQKVAQFQIGYKGYIQLGLRTAAYKRMNARIINREAFKGYDEVGEPIIDWAEIDESKPTFGYVFAFQLVNGFVKCCLWTKARVESHAQRYSQSYRSAIQAKAEGKSKETPWLNNFDEMALKTVVANELRRWGILSIQMERAYRTDQTAAVDVNAEAQFVDSGQNAAFGGGEPEQIGNAGSTVESPQSGSTSQPAAGADEKAEADLGLAPEQKPGSVAESHSAPTDTPSQAGSGAETAPAKTVETELLAAENRRRSKTGQAPVLSPQEQLAKICTEHGVHFDKFRTWAAQFIKDADSITTWEELPADVCKFWLKADPHQLCKKIEEYQP